MFAGGHPDTPAKAASCGANACKAMEVQGSHRWPNWKQLGVNRRVALEFFSLLPQPRYHEEKRRRVQIVPLGRVKPTRIVNLGV